MSAAQEAEVRMVAGGKPMKPTRPRPPSKMSSIDKSAANNSTGADTSSNDMPPSQSAHQAIADSNQQSSRLARYALVNSLLQS